MVTALLLSLVLSISGSMTTYSAPDEPVVVYAEPIISSAELQLALRDLWTGHIFWLRSYVVASHYEDAAAADAADAKTVENARAIADAIVPFYGPEAGNKLFGLLAGHYRAVKDYMKARFAGGKGEAATKNLTANAAEIAAFLSGANPHLPRETVLTLLLAHGGHHIQQINVIEKGDFSSEAASWDAMLAHMHQISDALAGALARQFPDKVEG